MTRGRSDKGTGLSTRMFGYGANYHIDSQTLFEEVSVKLFKSYKYREICEYKLYAYCLKKGALALLIIKGS